MRTRSTRFKRIIDLGGSVCGLVVLSPVIALVAWRVRRDLGTPVLFKQERPGLDGRPFQILKFRTMLRVTDSSGQLLDDEARLTEFGRLLRKTSLDELPELWNVLRGDMSLVGPRPLLMEYLDLYTQDQMRRHELRPGITGWAQVNGRNAIGWGEKFTLDVWYVDNQSFWLDMRILFLTVVKVARREGISQTGEATVQYFDGTN